MNKLKAIFFLTLFLFSITGNSFVFNFCNGNLRSTTYLIESQCCCSAEVTDKVASCHTPQTSNESLNESCCSSQTLDFQIGDLTSSSLIKIISIIYTSDFFSFELEDYALENRSIVQKTRGVPILITDIHLKNQVFII